ncbi:putative NHL repeat containing protein [Candidatus Sulfopaludibacter sp. SbA4]|nr:putative NHL repeat containing protein [Candidatus Sulfopaludibacter sp. SbA4]
MRVCSRRWRAVLLLCGWTAYGQQYLTEVLAGSALPPTAAPAASTPVANSGGIWDSRVANSSAVAVDSAGNSFFIAENCVFKVDHEGTLTRTAGISQLAGYAGDGGPAVRASFNRPAGLAVDRAGNVYVADTWNHAIRKVTSDGLITTVAGTGVRGGLGNGGPAKAAQLAYPSGVAVDVEGDLYVADTGNYCLRRVAVNGTISTFAGAGAYSDPGDGGPATLANIGIPYGLAVDISGNVFIADKGNSVIRKVLVNGTITTVAGSAIGYSGDGGPALKARLHSPIGIAVGADGSLYIADSANQAIRRVAPDGSITTVAGTGAWGFSGDGGPAVKERLALPMGVAVDPTGSLYIADSQNERIRKVAVDGTILTWAGNGAGLYLGDGGLAAAAQFKEPGGIAVDAGGSVYVADSMDCRIRKITKDGIIVTVAGTGVCGHSPDGNAATAAQLFFPSGVAVDSSGNLYIAEGNRIRKINPNGAIVTIAGTGVAGYSGDGGTATSAQLYSGGVAVDSAGNIYVADSSNNRIRKVTHDGTITTVAGNGIAAYTGDGGRATAASLNQPAGVACDSAGNLYVADTFNNVIRKVKVDGIISTIAGSGPMDSTFDYPAGIAVDAVGSVYVADTGGSDLARIAPDGTLTRAATSSDWDYYFTGCTPPCYPGGVEYPQAVAVDAAGSVYVADAGNYGVRLLVPPATRPLLSAALNHIGNLMAGQATFSATVSNAESAIPSEGTVTITEFPPSGVTIVSMSGQSWNCSRLTCSRNDPLGQGTSYPPIAITVQVSPDAPPQVINQVSVSGGGSVTAASSDVANVIPVPPLAINPSGLVNAASYTASVAPGSIATVFGSFPVSSAATAQSLPLPTTLSGLAFEFGDATQAPLFAVAGSQANIQIPWELAGQAQTTLAASANGQSTSLQSISIASFAPGIFTSNAQGSGQGLILDSSYRLTDATNPATAGSAVVTIYCTGLGPVTNQPPTGSITPGAPLAWTNEMPTVTIGGVPAQVLFSGLAPGGVGVYQINARVPSDSVTGGAVPVVVTIAGATSNTVTIAVKAAQ